VVSALRKRRDDIAALFTIGHPREDALDGFWVGVRSVTLTYSASQLRAEKRSRLSTTKLPGKYATHSEGSSTPDLGTPSRPSSEREHCPLDAAFLVHARSHPPVGMRGVF
jgi:hypothetical protein